jgi:hypothetical protein
VNIWLFSKQYFCILVTSTQDEISSWIAKEAQINGEGNPPFYHPFLASQISNIYFKNTSKLGDFRAEKYRFYLCGFYEPWSCKLSRPLLNSARLTDRKVLTFFLFCKGL